MKVSKFFNSNLEAFFTFSKQSSYPQKKYDISIFLLTIINFLLCYFKQNI